MRKYVCYIHCQLVNYVNQNTVHLAFNTDANPLQLPSIHTTNPFQDLVRHAKTEATAFSPATFYTALSSP